MSDRKDSWYVQPEELARELELSQRQGSPTIKVCEYFREIAKRLLRSPQFSRYPESMKEDLASAALEKCLKNVANYKPQFAAKCFSYYTRACLCAFYVYLNKYYRHKNLIRDLTRNHAEELQSIFPSAAQELLSRIGTECEDED